MEKLILFQGDSITDAGRNRELPHGMGVGYANMTAGELAYTEPYKYIFRNRGISGNRVVDLFARMKVDMINMKPDIMSILIGVNDVWHEYTKQNGVSAEKFEMVYDLLIRELLEELPDLKLMIMEPFVLPGSATENTPEHPERWDFFSKEVPLRAAAAKRLAEKYNLPFVPLQQRLEEANANAPSPDYWLRDGVHPTAAGHVLLKNAWLEAYKEYKLGE
ncbi:MAG: hypothetical protein IKU07_02900 [Oscillospiraceae bacterium]|nr:hypothetical protein [Oscillospiraceae bacterium]